MLLSIEKCFELVKRVCRFWNVLGGEVLVVREVLGGETDTTGYGATSLHSPLTGSLS